MLPEDGLIWRDQWLLRTCVSTVVHGEGLVAVLAVAQRGQGGQIWVVFSLSGNHINGGLRGAGAVGEVLRPLRLSHQAFEKRKDGKR